MYAQDCAWYSCTTCCMYVFLNRGEARKLATSAATRTSAKDVGVDDVTSQSINVHVCSGIGNEIEARQAKIKHRGDIARRQRFYATYDTH